MGKMNFIRAAVAAGAASAALLVGTVGTADATVVQHANSTRPFSATVNGTSAHFFKSGSTQAYAVVTKVTPQKPKPPKWKKVAPVGVSARAQCEARNGASRWYESTVHVTKVGRSSVFDCRFAGPFNRAVIGLGGNFY